MTCFVPCWSLKKAGSPQRRKRIPWFATSGRHKSTISPQKIGGDFGPSKCYWLIQMLLAALWLPTRCVQDFKPAWKHVPNSSKFTRVMSHVTILHLPNELVPSCTRTAFQVLDHFFSLKRGLIIFWIYLGRSGAPGFAQSNGVLVVSHVAQCIQKAQMPGNTDLKILVYIAMNRHR